MNRWRIILLICGLFLTTPLFAGGLHEIGANVAWEKLNARCLTVLKGGDFALAEDVCAHALAEVEKEGRESSRLSASLNNLGVAYDRQKKYDQALTVYLRALDMDKRVHGARHSSVAADLVNLAELQEHRGQYAQAETAYREAIRIREERLGHADTKVTHLLSSLAYVIEEQGRLAEAEPLHFEVFLAFERSLGRLHPNTVRAARNLAFNYLRRGEKVKAKPYVDILAEYDRHIAAKRAPADASR